MRNGFERFSGFTPGCQAAHDYKRVESFLPQQVRHPGACGFARSSAVHINVLILRQVLKFFS